MSRQARRAQKKQEDKERRKCEKSLKVLVDGIDDASLYSSTSEDSRPTSPPILPEVAFGKKKNGGILLGPQPKVEGLVPPQEALFTQGGTITQKDVENAHAILKVRDELGQLLKESYERDPKGFNRMIRTNIPKETLDRMKIEDEGEELASDLEDEVEEDFDGEGYRENDTDEALFSKACILYVELKCELAADFHNISFKRDNDLIDGKKAEGTMKYVKSIVAVWENMRAKMEETYGQLKKAWATQNSLQEESSPTTPVDDPFNNLDKIVDISGMARFYKQVRTKAMENWKTVRKANKEFTTSIEGGLKEEFLRRESVSSEIDWQLVDIWVGKSENKYDDGMRVRIADIVGEEANYMMRVSKFCEGLRGCGVKCPTDPIDKRMAVALGTAVMARQMGAMRKRRGSFSSVASSSGFSSYLPVVGEEEDKPPDSTESTEDESNGSTNHRRGSEALQEYLEPTPLRVSDLVPRRLLPGNDDLDETELTELDSSANTQDLDEDGSNNLEENIEDRRTDLRVKDGIPMEGIQFDRRPSTPSVLREALLPAVHHEEMPPLPVHFPEPPPQEEIELPENGESFHEQVAEEAQPRAVAQEPVSRAPEKESPKEDVNKKEAPRRSPVQKLAALHTKWEVQRLIGIEKTLRHLKPEVLKEKYTDLKKLESVIELDNVDVSENNFIRIDKMHKDLLLETYASLFSRYLGGLIGQM